MLLTNANCLHSVSLEETLAWEKKERGFASTLPFHFIEIAALLIAEYVPWRCCPVLCSVCVYGAPLTIVAAVLPRTILMRRHAGNWWR